MLRRLRVSLIGLTLLAALVALPRVARTHEPITTKVMFNKEVIRILERNCLACHAPGKIKADIPLTTYEEARPWAKAIKEEVLEKRMMPFQAVKGYGSFQHDYILSQRDIELLTSWIEGGAPRGDAKDYPKELIEQRLAGKTWPLGQPDLLLQPDSEAQIAADGDDEERCFVLPTGLKQARWLSALDFQPGNGNIVYHAAFFLAKEDVVPPNVRLSACAIAGESLGNWVPGQASTRLPAGFGRSLPADAQIVLKIRYHKNGEAAADRSRLALYFAPANTSKAVRDVAIKSPAVTIPANAENYRLQASYTVPQTAQAVALRPRLFPFAKFLEASAHRPDGSVEVLLIAREYRYDWQPAYVFKKPVSLPKGTRIEIVAYLDNSENNPRLPNDVSQELKFDDPLCELSLANAPLAKQVRR